MEWPELPDLFPELPGPARWLPLLQRHAALIEAAEPHTRVTAVAPEDAVRRQYGESLELWRISLDALGEPPNSVVDVGSGGGFPGLVAACVAPAVRFALVEPLRKRARLLEEAAAELGLSNVEVLPARAEDAGRGALRSSAGLVMARAVAPLRELLEYAAPFARAQGMLALAKGSAWAGELAESAEAQARLSCTFSARFPMRPELSEAVSILLFRQDAPVGALYPRRAGLPRKRPL